MSINIIQTVLGLLGQDKIGQIAGMLGESPDAVGKGLGGAIPAVLGGLISKGESAGGAGALVDLFTQNQQHGGGLLDNIGSILGSGAQANQLMTSGGGILSSILGGNTSGMLGTALSAFSGLRGGSATSLLGLAAPLVMGAISKHLSGGISASGLTDLLASQKDHVKAALPAPLAGAMGLGNMGAGASAMATGAATAMTGAATAAAAEVKSGLGLWPWLLGAAALAALFFGMRSCKKEEPVQVAEPPAAVEPAPAPAAEPAPAPAAETPAAAPAPAAPPTEAELAKADTDELVAFLKSPDAAPKNFVFESLKFETGKAALTAESQVTVDNIAKTMAEFPNVTIRLDGYTDNVGNPASNKKLSAARAAQVAAALVAKGVDKARVGQAGNGDANPIGDNATADGKAKNRRIEVVVTKK